jgi:hypothetical protein
MTTGYCLTCFRERRPTAEGGCPQCGNMLTPTESSVWLNVTTADGVLLERIALGEYNLSKPLARAALLEEIRAAAERARSH